MKDTYYITTPLYYVNAEPHIGHSYTTIACDIDSRYRRILGEKVYFLTGTDEHGANIEKIALQKGVSPKQWSNDIVAKFKNLWEILNINYSGFIRTTDPHHEKAVQLAFEEMLKNGDIYKGEYSGWYCFPCESYIEESEIIADEHEHKCCPVHKRPLEQANESTYFFKLSKYQEPLLEHYKNNPNFLMPKHRAKEILNFVTSGLKDISVSRTKVKWGIPVQSDPDHTIYVWFEALQNYLTAIGYGKTLAKTDEDKKFFEENTPKNLPPLESLWPADVHFMGKEIYRFHSVIWPAILMSLGMPLPKQVFAHGWWTVNGDKMSKSTGNFIDPKDICAQYGTDALRYFLFREVPFGTDGDFSMNAFKQRYNGDLANDFGNLLSRSTNMVDKYLEGKAPAAAQDLTLLNEAKANDDKYHKFMKNYEYDKALDCAWKSISSLNQAIEQNKPWAMAKENPQGLEPLFFNIIESLKIIVKEVMPFMPETMETVSQKLNGEKIEKMPPLFPRKA